MRIKLYLPVMAFMLLSTAAVSQNNTYHGTDAGNGTNGGQLNATYGYQTGNVVIGNYNSFFGANAGLINSSGANNVFIGYNAGDANVAGAGNTFVGSNSGTANTSTGNTFIGYYSGFASTSSTGNVFSGYQSGRSTTTGSTNTFYGYQSGYSNVTGFGNVFLGAQAGYNETGSNKLYIDNSNVSTPLIYGDFSANRVGINSLPNSTHTLTVGGTVHATAFYQGGQQVAMWNTVGADVNYTSGNVSIGTANPYGYKLAVAGKIISEEVVIKLQAAWPDYVFESDYQLMPLAEVAKYIKANKHLPNVPDAAEIKKNGVEVGEMNVILLKKMEEMTLYVIELEKRIKELEAKK